MKNPPNGGRRAKPDENDTTGQTMAKASNVLNVRPKAANVSTGIADDDRKAVADVLSEIVGQTYRVLLRSQVVHWNVVGPLFQPVHVLTEQHYSEMFTAIDTLAERIRALGAPAPSARVTAGLDKALSLEGRPTVKGMVEELVEDHEGLARLIREGAEHAEEAKDFVTHDLLAARLAFHEKAVWMLRATIAD
ncbi:DNA starvation/stationary phase protection protein [Methylopila turkensis]|uniref:DNA starvation/stationary phase protection protein n=1 Tax=Methylopila turkensis TaxID=1437816 RepID=A0A9W6N4V3_9HYPH|nr:DNA starvation/stationary phase protection protein [Methylopila turkensis]